MREPIVSLAWIAFISYPVNAFRVRRASVAGLQLTGHATGNETCEFLHGVAAGDPLPTAVVIWTRATPLTNTSSAQGFGIGWSIWPAGGNHAGHASASGEALASAEHDFTVKVDVSSGLQSGVDYNYQFSCGRTTSPIGHFRLPPPYPERLENLTYAVFSCSNWVFGRFWAYAAAAREPLDFWVHVGDFIYEYGRLPTPNQEHPVRNTVTPTHEILTIDDYRRRYALYRTDPSLQQLSALAPVIGIWDDHEIANDAWRNGAQNHNQGEGSYNTRKADAIRAYHEWMPTREADVRWKQRYEFGDLASLVILDTRLTARTSTQEITEGMIFKRIQGVLQDAGDFTPDRWKGSALDEKMQALQTEVDAHRNAKTRHLLGHEQLAWLRGSTKRTEKDGLPWALVAQGLAASRMKAPDYLQVANHTDQWAEAVAKALAPESEFSKYMRVVAAAGRYGIATDFDSWPGYMAERNEFLQALDATQQTNVIVYGGDSHNAWTGHLRAPSGKVVASAFDGMSVSSPGLESYMPFLPPGLQVAAMQAADSDLVWADTSNRGFMLMHLTHDAHDVQYITVDVRTSRPSTPSCLQAFRVSRGDPIIRKVACCHA